MPRAATKYTQADVARLLAGCIKGGFPPARVELEGNKISVWGIGATPVEALTPLEKWRAEHGED